MRADPGRLQEALSNLFRNSVEHGSTPNGGTVNVRVGELDGGFFVKDDGPGIPEEERDRVFAAGHTTAENSTGFGLNIVGTIVQAHGWEVRVTEGHDGGARFAIGTRG